MRVGIFTDSHYSSKELTCGVRYNSRSLGKIAEAIKYFNEQQCDLIICLGDVTDKENDHKKEKANLKSISEVFEESTVPIFALMGNHDAFCFGVDEFYEILGEKYRPENVYGKVNLIFLDTCYFKSGEHYKQGDYDWEDTFLPDAQKLGDVLSELLGNSYAFMHHNVDPEIPEDHKLFNCDEVREIFEKHGVKTVFQGHFHQGNVNEHNGVRYVTCSAMCQNEKAYGIYELE